MDPILCRRHLLLSAAALCLAGSAFADDPAEAFVRGSIQTGFDILNDASLSLVERRRRFAAFLLGLTDLRRVALFLLGRYRASVSPEDLDAYLAAYKGFLLVVYQSYFASYAGQSLRVRSSRQRAPGDYIVATDLVGGDAPIEVDFRVALDSGKPVLVDIGVAGIWLALAERDQFVSVLAQNNGDIKALITHLRTVQAP